MSEGLKNYGKLNIPDFIWWLGIVEDNNDPTYAGRVKVRITGYHTGNKQTLPIKHFVCSKKPGLYHRKHELIGGDLFHSDDNHMTKFITNFFYTTIIIFVCPG